MKKMIFLALVLVFAAGCGAPAEVQYDEKNVPKSAENFDDSDVRAKIDDLKNPQQNRQKAQEQSTNQSNNNNMNENKSVTLQDLTQEYSSAIMKTNLGDITLKFYADASPATVNNFLNLSKDGFYNGTRFHRVIKDFMIQGGDPKSKEASQKDMWGTGDPGYKFNDEFNDKKLVRGSLAMANSGPNTNGSQFFIVTAESTPWLDGKHTNFGYVSEGMDIVEKIEASATDERDRPLEDVVVESVELAK